MADFLGGEKITASSLDSWLPEEWQRYLTANNAKGPKVLQAWQSLVLWEGIIANDSKGAELFNSRSVARLAKEAWDLSRKWQLSNFESETEEHAAFLTWSRAYQASCEASSWIDRAVICDALIEAHQSGHYTFPKEITYIGFESLNISPQFNNFLKVAASTGSLIHEQSLVSKKGDIKRVLSANPNEEIMLAAKMANLWRKQNPGCRIGIVVPDLSQQRNEVVRIFKAHIDDEADVNIAAPISFASYPMIDAALLGLRLFQFSISLEDVSLFLRSPFFAGGMTESLTRAKVDAFLRKRGEETFTFSYLCDLPVMTDYFRPCLDIMPTLKGLKLSTQWMLSFQTILETLGWPGDRTLNGDEDQELEKWQSLLGAYRDSAAVLGEHTFSDALTHLRHLTQETTFLPQGSNKDASIQVLGLLEAVGLPFDYLWVMGLHQQSWPQMPNPNPLIPLSLQKKQGLPRSSFQREYAFAIDVTARLCQAAPMVIFSQAALVADEHCEASPLLAAFPVISIDKLGIENPQSYLKQQFEMAKMQTPILHDFAESAPRLGKDEKLSMGAHTLKLQTLCPFRAFAETRLRAKSLEKVVLGLRANERGEIVHQILEAFWKEVKNKTNLDSLSQDALNTCLQSKINDVLSRFQQKYPVRIKKTYLQLEEKRLHLPLSQLLALEKTRDNFEVIAMEEVQEISIGPLHFNIRIDRIDRVSNGEEVLIDYKTGKTSVSDWFADNIQDPQLPLYSITREKVPQGLVFAIIRADGIKFQGVLSGDECTIPGTKCRPMLKFEEDRTWAQQQLAWRENLESKAFAFYEGHANVEPLQGESTCRLCDLKPLCRIGSKGSDANLQIKENL